MTELQKRYIEQNINLIENEEWEEFFQYSPDGLGEILIQAGIDFMLPLKRVPVKSFSDSSVTYVNIPEGVTNIEPYAFAYCLRLERITIPDSVTSIGNFAFYNCGRIKINYNGTVAQWKQLIGNNDSIFKFTTYTCNCSDGTIKESG